ncbi:transglycosylase family protein [Salinifilum ghardaiensis]
MARYRGKHRKPSNSNRTVARVAVAGAVVATPMAIAAPANAADWDALAQCESSGDWSANTGNGYYGGLQFDPTTWSAYGGGEYAANAHQATREQQIEIAEKVLSAQGVNAWPGCTAKISWTSGTTDYSAETSTDSESSASSTQYQAEQTTESTGAAASGSGTYTVQNGDTLGEIGTKFGTDFREIFEQNRDVLDDPNLIFPGQQLSIN